MIVHLRLSTPADMTDPVVGLLVEDPRVTDVTLVRGAGIEPPRDVVEADVAREAASDVLGTLTRMGLGTRGGISMTETTVAPCESARELERQAVGSPDDAVIWDVVLSHAESATRHTVSFHAFLTLATALAAIAVITDSPVLVVGAMVVGPEFGTIAAICCGIAFGRWLLAWRALALLVTGENPGLTQRDLSGAVGTSEAATSRAVASLVAEGLVVSAPVPGGGNRRALRLTESGRSLVERASELLGSSFDDVARSLGIDPATLADDIRRLSSALTEESP